MPQCAANTKKGTPCPYKAKEGQKYCGTHLKQKRWRKVLSAVSIGIFSLGVLGFIANITGILDYFGIKPVPHFTPITTQVAWVYVTPVGQQTTIPTLSLSLSNPGAIAKCFDVGSGLNGIAWVSQDLLATSGSAIRIWRTTDGILQRTISPQVGGIRSMAISPDGKTIITSESSYDSGYIVFYDATTGYKIREIEWSPLSEPTGKWVNIVLFSPDGKTFAGGSNDGGVRIWNSQTGELIQLFNHSRNGELLSGLIELLAYSPDSQILATGSSDPRNDKYRIYFWRISDGQLLFTLEFGGWRSIDSIAFSPNGTTFAVGTDVGPINLYKVVDGSQLATLEGHLNSVNSLSWAPDGSLLASGGSDKTIRLWNPLSGNQVLLLSGHSDSISSVAFSKDGKALASGSDDHKVCLWENIP